jgi:predicted dehydrogenase/threonine dehydrogenase-like Zn-dependent dehydrogenase
LRQVFRRGAGFSVEDAPEPSLPADGVLVRVERSLISPGTEMRPLVAPSLRGATGLVSRGLASLAKRGLRETWSATRSYLAAAGVGPDGERLPLGYSCAGTVVARAPVEGLPPVGARVACAGAGFAEHAEVVAVPRRLCALVPEGLSSDEAAYGALGAIALHAVRRAEAEPGEVVVVWGLGLVGLLVLQLARAAGLRAIGLDLDPHRVARARGLGAERAFSPAERSPVPAVLSATGGAGADRVLLCLATRSSGPANDAVRMCRRRGRVVVVGEVGLDLEREALFEREVDVAISTSCGPGVFDPSYEVRGRDYPRAHVRWTEQRNLEEVLRLVAARAVDVRALTDATFPLERAGEAYGALARARPRPVGVLLAYDPAVASRPVAALRAAPRERTVALIGAGDFVRQVHLPILLRRGFVVASVANRTARSAAAAAGACGASRAFTDYRRALDDPRVGLVVIGTRHDSHAEIAAAALDAGKHVLLEKPVATTREGLALVRAAQERNRSLVLAVGHNRRFSRDAIALRARLQERGGPAFLTYRVNASFVPASSWIQDPREGGGRIVGEGTHFLDTLAFLSGARPELLGASAVPPDGERVVARDSWQALLRLGGGALATLTYTAQGASELARERIEAFAGGASFVLDDWRALEGPGGRVESSTDKGHERLWEELEKALAGESSLLPPPREAFDATELALEIEERIRGLVREGQRAPSAGVPART